MDFDQREKLQRLWSPVTLRLAQWVLNIFRRYPLVTREQAETLRPFFIIGSGRSGTTLLRAILIRHPAVAIPPEAYGLVNAIKKFVRYGGMDWRDMVNMVLGEFQSHESFRFWETDLFDAAQQLYRLPRDQRSLASIIDRIYRCYSRKHHPEAALWGDKTPFNTLRLKWLARVFPGAKYIHMLRDGRAVVSSYLKAGLMPSLEAACERWQRSLDAVDRFSRRVPPSRFATVRYEELVREPESSVRRLCAFLEVPFLPEMLAHTQVHLGDESLSHLQNATKPVTDAYVERWRTELTPEQQARTWQLLRRKLVEKGYATDR